jgi:fucose permease
MDNFQTRFVLFICAFAFLLVGIENALSGWIASYVARLESSPDSLASFYQAAFWASMLLGRATAPTLLNRLSEIRLIVSGISIAACGILFILASLNRSVILLGVCIAGLGLASVFPTTIAIFSHVLGAEAARKSSWLFASGSLGSSTLPFLVGLVSAQFASLRIGLTVPLIAALLGVALQINLMILIKRLNLLAK